MRSGGYKCYNIQCGSCIGKTLCGEPEDAALGCDNRIVNRETRGDRIRSMTNEQMAKDLINMIAELCEDGVPCYEFALEWFNRTAEED